MALSSEVFCTFGTMAKTLKRQKKRICRHHGPLLKELAIVSDFFVSLFFVVLFFLDFCLEGVWKRASFYNLRTSTPLVPSSVYIYIYIYSYIGFCLYILVYSCAYIVKHVHIQTVMYLIHMRSCISISRPNFHLIPIPLGCNLVQNAAVHIVS